MSKKNKSTPIEEEAAAFDKRMTERSSAGFIPDLRDAVKCDYFYKSFFRDPYFMKLYQGQMTDLFVNGLEKHKGKKLTILDVGCGPGLSTLEIARNGHNVTAIDISEKSIELAKKALANNRYKKNFGLLNYQVLPFEEVKGKFDAIIFSGALHHFPNLKDVVKKSVTLLNKDGILLCYEPWHEKWRKQDAAQVALFRMILSITGFWYEKNLFKNTKNKPKMFDEYVDDIHLEYVSEKDKNEPDGQSPNDNAASGDEIIKCLNKYFVQKELKSGFSFIYRFLGGMRGSDEILHRLADLFTVYDQYAVENGWMNSNAFFYIGTKNNIQK